MSVGDVLDGSFGGLRATFVPVAMVVVLLLGPLQLVLNLALSWVAPEMTGGGFLASFGEFDDAMGMGDPLGVIGVTSLFGLASFFIALIAGAATIALVLQVDRAQQTDVRSALRSAVSVLGTTVGATLILGIGGGLGFLVFVLLMVALGAGVPVVGPILAVVASLPTLVIGGAALFGVINLVVPIAVVERQGPIATLGRAMWVLRRRFWRLIGITLLVGLLVALATFGLQLPFLLLGALLSPVAWAIEAVGEVLAQIVSVPVTSFAALLVYLDARVRHEGLDLQLRARDIGGA